MAQPIPLTVTPRSEPDPPARLDDSRLDTALQDHSDAILSALQLLQLLHDRGVLDLLRGLVGAGDQLTGMATAALDSPDSVRAIRNFILLTKFFASIPPDVLDSLVRTAKEGAEREKSHRAPGLLQLLRRMSSENSRHAIAVSLDLLESAGKSL
jgi:uncharacterized protein YjgD (DUF1641 family)